MKLTDYFNVLLKDTVNLGQVKLGLLNSRVEAVYKALMADEQIGHLILGKTPQGSWAHKTIINPVGSNEFDADFMLDMSENPDWANDPRSTSRRSTRPCTATAPTATCRTHASADASDSSTRTPCTSTSSRTSTSPMAAKSSSTATTTLGSRPPPKASQTG